MITSATTPVDPPAVGDGNDHKADTGEQPILQRGVDLRLVPAALAAWVGAVIGLLLGFTWRGVIYACTFFLTAAAVMLVAHRHLHVGPRPPIEARASPSRRPGPGWTIAVAVLVSSMAWGSGVWARVVLDQGTPVSQGERAEVVIEGHLATDPTKSRATWSSTSWVATVVTDHGGKVILTADTASLSGSPLIRGSRLEIRGVLDRREPMTPHYLGFLRAESVTLVQAAPTWQRSIHQLKERLNQRAQAQVGNVSALVTGMALGDDRALDEDQQEAMLATSLTHLTAVSGSHIAITVGLISILLPGRKHLRRAFTAAFLVAVVAVVGPEPAVLRSVATGALAIWGLLLHRSGFPLSLLLAVTVATILLSPWSAVSYGFALSTLATLGLLTAGRHWTRLARARLAEAGLSTPASKSLGILIVALMISLAAQLATLPILPLMNPWLPTWGLLANLLVAPAVTPITLLGLGAAATVTWAPGLADLLLAAAGPFARYLDRVANTLSTWPAAQAPWPSGATGSLLAAAVTVGVAAATTLLVQTTRRGAFGHTKGQTHGSRQ